MRRRVAVGVAMAAYGWAVAATAQCTVSADQNAVVRPLAAQTQADANVILSMSLLPRMMHLDYAGEAGKSLACDLGSFAVGDATYELSGEDQPNRQRKALPARKGEAIAEVVPIVDVMEAVKAAGSGKSAPVTGYMLATITKTDLTGWRYYTGMPDEQTIKHDIGAALGKEITPIFRNGTDGKTEIFVTKG